jgi:hypothetical protein
MGVKERERSMNEISPHPIVVGKERWRGDDAETRSKTTYI